LDHVRNGAIATLAALTAARFARLVDGCMRWGSLLLARSHRKTNSLPLMGDAYYPSAPSGGCNVDHGFLNGSYEVVKWKYCDPKFRFPML
jgi:hypothetical protein